MGMEIEAVAVALNGDDDAREGCRVRGNLPKHLPEGLPGGLAEQAEVAAVELENGAQELGNGEDELGVADRLEDVAVEPLGEKQDAFLLACGTEESAFAGICEDRLVAAAAAVKTREASVKVSTFQILAHHLADDGAPGAVLLLVAVVVDALELLVIVLDQRIERSSARVAGFINSSRCGLHTPDNSQGWRLSQNIRTLRLPAFP
jgi:hypothetical protein